MNPGALTIPTRGDRAAPEFEGRREVRLQGSGKRAIENARNRLIVTAALFALFFIVLAGRIVDLGITGDAGDRALASNATPAIAGQARRAIVDRNGKLLAGNLPTASLYAHPHRLLDATEAARRLTGVLPDLDRSALTAELASKRKFVWIKRKLIPRQQWAVNSLGIPGLEFRTEMLRIYPQGPLAAHVLGYVDIDNEGIAGVERFFDDDLIDPGRSSAPLQLSLDIRIQHALRQELLRAMATYGASGAMGLVMDSRSGEVLAMTSLPDFDPNDPGAAASNAKFNRATLGVYEMGSTFKTFTIAQALDSGVATLADGYDATAPIHIARWTIRDDHPRARWLSVPEIYIYSSNIGAAKIALDIGIEAQRKFLGRLGMLRRPQIELPEVGSPIAPSPWRQINTMTIAYGHGLAVSPLQLVSGVAAMVNGGVLVPATLIKVAPGTEPRGDRVIGGDTSEVMRALMRLAVLEGTGSHADAAGYLVGGKTGTAEKFVGGSYRRKALLSSFVGIFPSTDARYVVLAMLDEPKGRDQTFGFAGGGWTAAPVVRRVVMRIAPMLGVSPRDPEEEAPGGVTLASAGQKVAR